MVELAQLGIGKNPYYDRNPLNTGTNAGVDFQAAPPTTEFVISTYTAPSNRLALITGGRVKVQRITNATTPRKAAMYIIGTPDVTKIYLYARIDRLNTAGDTDHQEIGGPLLLVSGQSLSLAYVDLSTGGTNSYDGFYYLTEFDI